MVDEYMCVLNDCKYDFLTFFLKLKRLEASQKNDTKKENREFP